MATQSDAVIWDIINHQFCSFKSKVARERTFCQNPHNVTGLCLKQACPLANSQYATIREEEGICYLYMKTIERAHTPKDLWEKIKLPANYSAALEIVSTQLEHFPKYLVHRNKQRLTKIHQMIIRMRKLKLKAGPKIVTTNTKVEQREVGRERKALKAAQLDRAIENELLERLKQVSEGEIYNYPEKEYTKALSKAQQKYRSENPADKAAQEEDEDDEEEDEEEEEGEYEDEEGAELEGEWEEEDGEDDGELNVQYVEDFDPSDDEDGDIEELDFAAPPRKSAAAGGGGSGGSSSGKNSSDKRKRKDGPAGGSAAAARRKGPRVEIEYEEEEEQPAKMRALN
jgi:protein MAK16